MENVDSLIQKLRQALPNLLADLPVTLAYLYGSTARGSPTPLSDVDIALVAERSRLTASSRLDLELEVEADLEIEYGIADSDVRVINDAPIVIQGAVATKGILLFSRDESTRVQFETLVRKEYFDFQPIAEQQHRAFVAALERELSGQS